MNNDILPVFDEERSDSLSIELMKVEGIDSCLAFSLSGQIDAYSSLFFQRSVKKAIDAGFPHLQFLLNSVDYVSSMGVGALVHLQQTLKGKGGDIAIIGVQPTVMEVFRLMCLEEFFRCPACGAVLWIDEAGRYRNSSPERKGASCWPSWRSRPARARSRRVCSSVDASWQR